MDTLLRKEGGSSRFAVHNLRTAVFPQQNATQHAGQALTPHARASAIARADAARRQDERVQCNARDAWQRRTRIMSAVQAGRLTNPARLLRTVRRARRADAA